MSKNKKRLDARLAELYPQYSRTQLQGWIMRGDVFVNEQKQTKTGTFVTDEDVVDLRADAPKFVSRAGLKLEGALNHFGIDVHNLVLADAGLSTGGFTDCLLQRGAKKIYGIDVGYGQVHEKIRQDPRVVVIERTNLRELYDVGEKVDGMTLDLSFISLTKVIANVHALVKPRGFVVMLIKPQFEAGRHEVGKGGIVRDPAVHAAVVERVRTAYEQAGFCWQGIVDSPITGTDGNKEFLAYLENKKCD